MGKSLSFLLPATIEGAVNRRTAAAATALDGQRDKDLFARFDCCCSLRVLRSTRAVEVATQH